VEVFDPASTRVASSLKQREERLHRDEKKRAELRAEATARETEYRIRQ
jgi:hypothetical protein